MPAAKPISLRLDHDTLGALRAAAAKAHAPMTSFARDLIRAGLGLAEAVDVPVPPKSKECPHPKAAHKVYGWGTVCSACKTRLR